MVLLSRKANKPKFYIEKTMVEMTNVMLENASKTSGWQSENTVQIVDDNIHICLEKSEDKVLRTIQECARTIETLGVTNVSLMGELWDENTQWAFALGFTCVGKLMNVKFTGDDKTVKALNDKLAVYGWCRELTNQTPSQLYPMKLAETTATYLSMLAPTSIVSTVISGEELLSKGWVGIYNVGKGSVHHPCLLEVDFNPSKEENSPVEACLVGKGITFDSGGYSLKSNVSMFDMKCDMGGAAVVAGALALAIKRGLNKRTKLFLCCAENMINNNAYKLGDILTYNNGVSVEVANTDAEGRLVLADGLIAASATKAPLIIDAATLTEAAVIATGGNYSAVLSLDENLSEQAKHCAEKVNEPLWQLPLEQWHKNSCPSAFADTANTTTQESGGAGDASNAAGFLSRFVESNGKGWLHFDLAASYNVNNNNLWATGATGLSIATIAELLN